MAQGLIDLRLEHTEEAADLLARTFTSNNPIWSSFTFQPKELKEFFVHEINIHLASQQRIRKEVKEDATLNVVYVHQGKIIAVGMNMELHEYMHRLNDPNEPELLKQFEFLQQEGKKMLDQVDLKNHEQNKHLYGGWVAVDDKVDPQLRKQFRSQAMLFTYAQFHQIGFKSMVLRASSPKSVHIYKSLGAKVLGLSEVQLKGQQLQLTLLELQFGNPVFQKLISSPPAQ